MAKEFKFDDDLVNTAKNNVKKILPVLLDNQIDKVVISVLSDARKYYTNMIEMDNDNLANEQGVKTDD